jgi:hypothetical protein
MTRKRIHYTPDDPDKFTLEEMTENRVSVTNRYEEKECDHWC